MERLRGGGLRRGETPPGVTQRLRDEFGVLAQPVAVALDGNDDGVMQQPIEQRARDDRIAKDLRPFPKSLGWK